MPIIILFNVAEIFEGPVRRLGRLFYHHRKFILFASSYRFTSLGIITWAEREYRFTHHY